jgi:hypothetical protein
MLFLSAAPMQAAGDHVVYVAMGTVVVLTEQQVGVGNASAVCENFVWEQEAPVCARSAVVAKQQELMRLKSEMR